MAGKKKTVSAFSVSLLDVAAKAAEIANKKATVAVKYNKWGFVEGTADEIELAVMYYMEMLLTANIAANTIDELAIMAIAPESGESTESLAERRRSFVDPFKAKMRTAAKFNGKRKLSMAKTVEGLSGKFMVLGIPGSFKERTGDDSNGKAE